MACVFTVGRAEENGEGECCGEGGEEIEVDAGLVDMEWGSTIAGGMGGGTT